MRMRMNYIAPLLAAGAVAVGIAAPAAAAADHQTCSASICQSPGNVEIHNPSPHVTYHPYGNMPYLIG
jgi:hypothetical protein